RAVVLHKVVLFGPAVVAVAIDGAASLTRVVVLDSQVLDGDVLVRGVIILTGKSVTRRFPAVQDRSGRSEERIAVRGLYRGVGMLAGGKPVGLICRQLLLEQSVIVACRNGDSTSRGRGVRACRQALLTPGDRRGRRRATEVMRIGVAVADEQRPA